MRILHTADWHLCDKLGRFDRTHDLETRVEVVSNLCDEHRVDVLLIAGDLFSERASVEQMNNALEHLHRVFANFFERSGTILAVTGNHDHDGRINMIRAGMRLATPVRAGGGSLARGRMYLLNGCFLASLAESDGSGCVQFVLVPYPKLSRYAEPGDQYRTKEEENRLLQGRVADSIHRLTSREGFDTKLPTVLVAHLHVRGAEVHTLYQMSERDDVVFEPGSLPTAWAYVALGHVHKAQALNGMAHVRYSGSLDRLDFGERLDERGVVLIDVGPAGLQGEPAWLPIAPTPFHDIVLTDVASELTHLRERYPDRETAIVRVTATPCAGWSRDEIQRTLSDLFPKLKEVKWTDLQPPSAESKGVAFAPRADHVSTVRVYLEERLKDDPDREAVLKLAEFYLKEGSES